MTEPENCCVAMARNLLAAALGINDLPDWHLVDHWLKWGAYLKLDVVPTVRGVIAARRANEPSWQPSGLQYFTCAIERARIARVMGLRPNAREIGPEFRARIVRVMGAPEKDDAREGQGGEGSTRHNRQVPNPGCACLWCGAAFRPRGASGKKIFCSDRCRAAYHRGLRVWAVREVDEGRLSLEAVRIASRKPYTESPEVTRRSGAME